MNPNAHEPGEAFGLRALLCRFLRFVRRHCVVLFVPVSIVLIFKIENPLLDPRYWGISVVVLLLSIIEACSYNAP